MIIPIAYSTGSLLVRKTTTATAVIGIGLVVFVLAASLMLSEGIKRTLGTSGRDDVGFVIRKGSDSELASNIDLANVGLILEGAEVKRSPEGKPQGLGELVVVAALEKVGAPGLSNVNIRGVPDNVLAFRSTIRIVEGRAARPGTDEAVVGTKIRGRFKNLELGRPVELQKNRSVSIVGIFADDVGSSFESEIWCDLDLLRTTFGRDGLVSSVRVKLGSAAAFDTFRARIESDQRLGLEAMRESVYYEKQSQNLATFVTVLGSVIAFFFSGGAMIGAMITMYALVSSRKKEIGTLRAIGFSRTSVLICFMIESVIIAIVGGLVGCAGSLGLGYVKFSLMNFATWSEVVFTFQPTPATLGMAMLGACVMGLLGGFLPAIDAARVSPIEAMRGG